MAGSAPHLSLHGDIIRQLSAYVSKTQCMIAALLLPRRNATTGASDVFHLRSGWSLVMIVKRTMSPSLVSNAKTRGRIGGNIATNMGSDIVGWMAIWTGMARTSALGASLAA